MPVITAKQVLEANQGTKYIEITLGGWDMHVNIYSQRICRRSASSWTTVSAS